MQKQNRIYLILSVVLVLVLLLGAGNLNSANASSALAPKTKTPTPTVINSPTPTPTGPTPTNTPSGSSNAFVRVNQVGYTASEPKRAYLLAASVETGATFVVKNSSGTTVYSAGIGASRGSWSNSFPYVYPLDFDTVTTAGTYTIVVSGPSPATSPSFKIDSAANLYSSVLSNSLFFFQVQRDGPNVITSVMNRLPAHLNDAAASTYNQPVYTNQGKLKSDLVNTGEPMRDVSGGWFDAGDYIKGVMTASYTAGMLETAARDFPAQVGSGTQADFFAESKFGTEFLMKMWDDNTKTMYYQVGLGDGNYSSILGDHDIWRLPQEDDTYGGTATQYKYIRNRPVLRAGPANSLVSPNLAGRLTAVYALCYQNFKTVDLTLANKCLMSAQHVFDLANTAPTGNLLTFAPFDYYPETVWQDDLEWGATELYFAMANATNLPSGLPHTDPAFYLQKGTFWANEYITKVTGKDTLNVYDVSTHAHYELYKAITQAGNPSGLAVTKAALLNDIKAQLDLNVAKANVDTFEYGLTYAAWDAVSHIQGLIVIASEYDELSGTTTYADFASHQIGYLFGSNAWGTSFVVGDGSTFPKCMQHQVANLVGSLNGSPPIVLGAPVNGPNSTGEFSGLGTVTNMRICPPNGSDVYSAFTGQGARYLDDVTAWPANEPAIDFAATTPLAFARWIAGLR
jgi:endoglucanase